MDPDSLAQVERIITAATNGLRQDMAALRQSTEATATDLRREMTTTAEDIKRHTGVLIEGLRHDMAALRQSTETTAGDIKRHTGVLIESLRHDIQSVAEGFQMHLDRRHAEDREYMDREFRELRALLKLSYA